MPAPESPRYGTARLVAFAVSRPRRFGGKTWQVRVRGDAWRVLPFVINGGGSPWDRPIVADPALDALGLPAELGWRAAADLDVKLLDLPLPLGDVRHPLRQEWPAARVEAGRTHGTYDARMNSIGEVAAVAITDCAVRLSSSFTAVERGAVVGDRGVREGAVEGLGAHGARAEVAATEILKIGGVGADAGEQEAPDVGEAVVRAPEAAEKGRHPHHAERIGALPLRGSAAAGRAPAAVVDDDDGVDVRADVVRRAADDVEGRFGVPAGLVARVRVEEGEGAARVAPHEGGVVVAPAEREQARVGSRIVGIVGVDEAGAQPRVQRVGVVHAVVEGREVGEPAAPGGVGGAAAPRATAAFGHEAAADGVGADPRLGGAHGPQQKLGVCLAAHSGGFFCFD